MSDKLRSLFVNLGRGGDWGELLGVGNPASHKTVQQYLKCLSEEQAITRVSPRQAIPIFFDKLTQLCSHLKEQVFSHSCSPLQRYLYARDFAFFCLVFFAGLRFGKDFYKGSYVLPGPKYLPFLPYLWKNFKRQTYQFIFDQTV